MRALVIDDAVTIRLFHRSVLEAVGFTVEEAANGVEALERGLAGAAPPDLMLVDVNMPILDGYGFLRAARAEPFLADVPVIMISTELQEGEAGAAYAAGANLFLGKPAPSAMLAHLAAAMTGMQRIPDA